MSGRGSAPLRRVLGSNHLRQGRLGVFLCFGRHFRAIGDAFREDELHVGDADEARNRRR